ncbi:MAG: NCS2 family permease [Spirochaetota bacterium]|nr:NCS2 family permease [Spirochaetota bacterium]
MRGLKGFFRFSELGTGYRTEIVAGVTTFITMSYIVVVNPAILEAAGIPKGPSMVATIVSAVFGTLIMGVYARKPFAIAPYMGENAFIAYTVVKVMGYSWQVALGAIFISGVLFTILTVTKVRAWLVDAIPMSLKFSFTAGIGLFLAFIGLNETGIVVLGIQKAPVHLGNLSDPTVLLSVAGVILMATLMILKVRGAILYSILLISAVAFISGLVKPPEAVVSLPPDISPIFLVMDVLGAISLGGLNVMLIVFVMALVDTIGTLIGLSERAGLLNDKGTLPDIEKPMLADALATTFAAMAGTTTSGAYIESATGIESGGKSGFTAVIVAILFLFALFFYPVVKAIPGIAYGPALIIIGLLMMSSVTRIDFSDMTESFPAFAVVMLMSFTYNIGVGITAGFILYPALKAASGRLREVHAGLWVLAALSLMFYIFYPYGP